MRARVPPPTRRPARRTRAIGPLPLVSTRVLPKRAVVLPLNRLRLGWWAVFLLAAGLPATARQAEPVAAWRGAPAFVTHTWRVADGLPHNTVMALAQTRDGYLWIGTINGLARFDGVQFRRFGLADGLPSLSVRALMQDRSGALWIGTDNGLSRYHDGRFTSWTVREGLAGDYITAVAEDGDGVIWIATRTGLNRWRQGVLERDAAVADRTVGGLVVDEHGSVLISASDLGLQRWNGQAWTAVPASPGPAPANPVHLFRDRAGRIWAGANAGLHCLETNTWTAHSSEAGLPVVGITSLTEGADGRLWVGTRDEGLFYLREGRFHRVTAEDGLADTAILATCEDGENNLWVGTRAGGLCRLRPRQVFVWHHLDGGVEVAPRSLAESADGAVWIAAYGRGLYRTKPDGAGQFVRQLLPSLPGVLWSDPIGSARDGSLWLATGVLLKQWRHGELVAEHMLPAELQGDPVRCLREDRERGLWIGTWSGRLLLLRDETFSVFSEGLPRAMASALAQQPDGTVWVGTYGAGLGRLKDGVGTTLAQKDGLSSDLVRALLYDSRGNLWVGTEGGGLNCLRDGAVRVLGPPQGLETDTVVQILEDDAGDLWLGTYQGVLRIARQDMEELLAGRRARLHPRKFDHADGLLSAQCNTGPTGALKTRDGRLFFCTYQGLLHIHPRQVTDAPTPPVVHLEDFLVAGRVWPLAHATGSAAPAIAPGLQRFEFRYTALRSVAAERVRFRYRMIGLESEWAEVESRRAAHYSYLPPGHYRFEVTAHGGDGVWNPAGATLAFTVLPHFWETWWFRIASWLGGVLFAVGIVVALLRQRHRRQLQALEHQRAVERERARIARDMHDELGSRLTKAGMIAEMATRDPAAQPETRQRIHSLRQTLDEVTATMDELVWAVNPKHDTLDGLANYLIRFTQEFFGDSPIRCELNIPPDLPSAPLTASLRHNLFLAYKEAVANAAKHAHPAVITVRAEFDGRRLRLEVHDDGAGFEPAVRPGRGRGLDNMRERLQSIGGLCTIESVPDHGTCVRFEVPLSAPPHLHGSAPSAPKVLQ